MEKIEAQQHHFYQVNIGRLHRCMREIFRDSSKLIQF